jgi:hypothetical protein
MRTLVSLTGKSVFLADWFKTVFMEDSENGGKGEMQERNRTVVYLRREKVEREILSFWWSSTSRADNTARVDGQPDGTAGVGSV